MPIKSIARQLGIGRNTVRGALASNEPPKYQQLTKRSIVYAVEPQIRQMLVQWPTVPTTVTAERISWTGFGQLGRPPMLVVGAPSRQSLDLRAGNRVAPMSANQAMRVCHVRG
ncbi:hypothetical protein [Amycolatopsis sp. cmx-4-54]|uniref:hypothetical protein n=1 Tax=Amycolatopsis sp. cmx-4-54 TaxID=2790936 RepID=UPI00397AE7EC